MKRKTYRKGIREVEIEEEFDEYLITFRIHGILVNFYKISGYLFPERKTIYEFLDFVE